MEHVDCVVVGAGVIGLAIARELSLAGREVIVLEAQSAIGTGVSARTNEAIPAEAPGPASSLKTQLSGIGSAMLRDYAASHGVPFNICGKLTIAQSEDEARALEMMRKRLGAKDGASVRFLSRDALGQMEPLLAETCCGALYSPYSGVIDTHALMLSLQGEAEEAGAQVVLNAPVLSGSAGSGGIELDVGGADPIRISAGTVVLCAGLGTVPLATRLKLANVPRQYLGKSHYFSLNCKSPFTHMIYPMRPQPPVSGAPSQPRARPFVPDASGHGLFGPDLVWVEEEDYAVPPVRADGFYEGIRLYWPGLPDGALEPAFAGIRPSIHSPQERPVDFRIDGPSKTGVLGLYALYGIEAPGMTACLALARHISGMLNFRQMAAQ